MVATRLVEYLLLVMAIDIKSRVIHRSRHAKSRHHVWINTLAGFGFHQQALFQIIKNT